MNTLPIVLNRGQIRQAIIDTSGELCLFVNPEGATGICVEYTQPTDSAIAYFPDLTVLSTADAHADMFLDRLNGNGENIWGMDTVLGQKPYDVFIFSYNEVKTL